jgi:hypothetical protein
MIIFISYSSRNRPAVETLVDDLTGFGHDVWFDQELSGGHVWWNDILEQIRQCDLFIFAISPEGMDSYPCKLEYTYGHQVGKHILPVLMADVNLELLPPILSAIQFVDYRQPDDKKVSIALGRALSNLPPPRPLPDPLPPPPQIPVSLLGQLREQIDAPTLSFQEQSAIITQLKALLANGEKASNVRELLERLRKRSDLYATIDREIGLILESLGKLETPVKKHVLPTRRPKEEKPAPASADHESLPKSDAPSLPVRLLRGIWNYLIVKPINGLILLLRAIWRYLIVKPISWLRVLFHHFMTKPITVWGVLWRYALVTAISFPLMYLASYRSYYYDFGTALIWALLFGGVIMGIFLAVRFALRNRVPFRQAKAQS